MADAHWPIDPGKLFYEKFHILFVSKLTFASNEKFIYVERRKSQIGDAYDKN